MTTTTHPALMMKSGQAPALSTTTVVFLPEGSTDTAWMQRVAKGEKKARTVFLVPAGAAFHAHVFSTEGPATIANLDLEAAGAAVATRTTGTSPPTEVEFITPQGSQRVRARAVHELARETSILSEDALQAQARSRNVDTLANLVKQVRSPLGVIPLVGAGLSAAIRFTGTPDRFPQWSDLLINMAVGTTKESDVRALVGAGDYERAAQMLDDHRPGVLPQRIKDAFDREVDKAQLQRGALACLPLLARGPVITTNFDHVLEQVFDAAGQPFRPIIPGPQPDSIIHAIHENQHALLKIHGDCRDRTFRVFTVEEYDKSYGVSAGDSQDASPERAPIGSLAWLMFSNRPLLCLGCSLEEDRTTRVLRALRHQLPGLTHYAILAGYHSLHRWDERQQQLDRMGIRALWFVPGQFAAIEALLRDVLERVSTRPLRPAPAPSATAAAPPPAETALVDRFPNLEALINAKPPDRAGRHVVPLITRALGDGKLAFFLGAHAHLGNLPLGNEFYAQLAVDFDCPALIGDRTAVAAFIVSRYGTQALWERVRALLSPVPAGPSALHRVLAALPAFLRARKRAKAAPLWIFTTNYDTAMEDALVEAGEPFHLVYYSGGTATEDEGLFIERAVDGSVRVIERPENLRALDPALNVVVKLNGGLVHDGSFTESVLIATGHFERFASRLPDALPHYLRTAFREKSLLFLGHGMIESDVSRLIQYSARDDRTVKSWAVQLAPEDQVAKESWQERVGYWRGWGVEIINSDLRRFLAALHQEWKAL